MKYFCFKQAEQFNTNIYMSEWYNCSPKVKKTLQIMMTRGQEEIKLTAVFIPINLNTSINVYLSKTLLFN